jgi:hypothetical protein
MSMDGLDNAEAMGGHCAKPSSADRTVGGSALPKVVTNSGDAPSARLPQLRPRTEDQVRMALYGICTASHFR